MGEQKRALAPVVDAAWVECDRHMAEVTGLLVAVEADVAALQGLLGRTHEPRRMHLALTAISLSVSALQQALGQFTVKVLILEES